MKTVIELAGEVDPVTKVLLARKEPQGMSHDVFIWFLERFEALVRADEREACARVCDDMMHKYWNTTDEEGPDPADCATAIRARGNT